MDADLKKIASLSLIVQDQQKIVEQLIKKAENDQIKLIEKLQEANQQSIGRAASVVQKVAAWSVGGFLVVILLCIGFLIHDKNQLAEKNEALEERVSQLTAALEGAAALEGKEDDAVSSSAAPKSATEAAATSPKPRAKKSHH